MRVDWRSRLADRGELLHSKQWRSLEWKLDPNLHTPVGLGSYVVPQLGKMI